MYQPTHFREDRLDVQHDLIRAHPLGLLVSMGPEGLVADPIPFVLGAADGPLGTLRCHLARANPHWQALRDQPDCLVVFQGAESYVTPSWYATKREHGRVVPTWNYATVHVSGRATVIEDAAWLARQIDDLTRVHEGARPAPWAVTDAPAPFIDAQMRGIVGIEIPIARIEGKWKVSQNRPEPDRRGVHGGLLADGDDKAAMAALVAERGGLAAGGTTR
jgi:transcriptional regulator